MGRSVEFMPSKQDFTNPRSVRLDVDRDRRVWLNNVMGVNKEGQLPARLLTGFLPSFTLAETLRELSNGKGQPVVRVFVPSTISHVVNDIPNDVIEKQVAQGTHVLSALSQNHFPDVEVFIERDQPPSKAAIDVLGGLAELAATIDTDAMNRIKVNGRNRGGDAGERNAEVYAAHHLFGWKDLHHAAIFSTEGPFTIINTMPPSEKPYTDVRQDLLQRIGESQYAGLVVPGQRYDFTIMLSKRAHYLLITDGDNNPLEPTLSEVDGIRSGEIVDNLRARSKDETLPPWTKDFLRRAANDVEKLVMRLGNGKADAKDATLNQLLGVKSLSTVT